MPKLQKEVGVASFFRYHKGFTFASSALMEPITKAFVSSIKDFAESHFIPVVRFRKGERRTGGKQQSNVPERPES